MGPVDPPQLAHQQFAFFGKEQGAGALIVGGEGAPRQPPVLEIVQQRDEIRTPDPDRPADLLLLQSRVLFDDRQHAVLHRTDVEPGKRPQEVTKYRELSLSESVPEEVGKMTEIGGFG